MSEIPVSKVDAAKKMKSRSRRKIQPILFQEGMSNDRSGDFVESEEE